MTDERLDITFRFRPLQTMPDGVLLSYLKSQTPSTFSHEMMLKAARAFWLAEAYQYCGGKEGAELKKLAQNMIFVLEEQVSYLRTAFNIERPIYMAGQSPAYSLNVMQPDLDEEEEEDVWDKVPQLDTGGL